ncbi:MAG TPA: hypothetical protein VGN16_09545 [Acidobacteriaceae bacterium]|jgi:hypothetical protein
MSDPLAVRLRSEHATVTEQLQAAKLIDSLVAENEKLVAALEIIAGNRPCADNLMGNVDIARAALGQDDPKLSQRVMLCTCGAVLENPAKYADHCAAFPSHFVNT